MKPRPIFLSPAYGRLYPSVDAMLNDWKRGRDFKMSPNGPYCSIRNSKIFTDNFWTPILVQGPIQDFPLLEVEAPLVLDSAQEAS